MMLEFFCRLQTRRLWAHHPTPAPPQFQQT